MNGVSPEYAISGNLLPQNSVSLDFSLNKFTSTITPPFGTVTRIDAENELATLLLKNGPLPAQLAFSHQDNTQTQMGIGENREDENTSLQLTVNHNIPHSASVLTGGYLDGHENVEDVSTVITRFYQEQEQQTGSFNNALQLGDGNWATLNSRATLLNDAGTYPLDEYTEDESLVLKHTDHLSSQYGADYSRTSVAGSTTELTALQAGLTHQLYDSLFTNLRVFGSHEDFAPSSEDIGGLSLQETYRKRIPWGTLTVDAGAGYQVTDIHTQPGPISIVNESHTLSNTAITFLNNPNVVLSTVVVTDSTGAILYLLNTDYTLTPNGTMTQIQRLPAGAIADGASVLVRYQYESNLPIEYGTTDLHGRLTLELFKHLSLYVGQSSLENSVLSGTNQGQLQNLNDTLFGTSVRWDPATVTAEHEIYDSTITPYVSDMVSLILTSPAGETGRMGANATYRHLSFESIGGQTLRTLGLSYQATPKDWPTFNVTAGYEWDNDLGVASEYEYARVALEYHYRGTTLSLEYQINHTNASPTTELSQYAFFSIRRRLF